MDKDYHDALHTKILTVMDIADWIYHDVRLNCDGKAEDRTLERFREVTQLGGEDAMFGLAAAWPCRAYWRLRIAYAAKGVEVPAILPTEVSKITQQTPGDEKQKRAMVSAQQFVSAVTQDDLEMAEAIFKAAWETEVAEAAMMMYTVLRISINISNLAYRMR